MMDPEEMKLDIKQTGDMIKQFQDAFDWKHRKALSNVLKKSMETFDQDFIAFETLINAIERPKSGVEIMMHEEIKEVAERHKRDDDNARYYDEQFWRLAKIISDQFGINMYTTAEDFVDEVEAIANGIKQASTDHGTGTTQE